MYSGGRIPIYTQEIFMDVGQSLLIALLDYDGINPLSRLIKSKTDTFEEALIKVKKDMKK